MTELRDAVFAIVKAQPGVTRQKIVDELGDSGIFEKDLTNCLTALRRNGKIKNRGTRKYPHWYAAEQTELEAYPKVEWDDFFRESDERLRRSLAHIAKLPRF